MKGRYRKLSALEDTKREAILELRRNGLVGTDASMKRALGANPTPATFLLPLSSPYASPGELAALIRAPSPTQRGMLRDLAIRLVESRPEVTAGELTEAGISQQYLIMLRKRGYIRRIRSGVYGAVKR